MLRSTPTPSANALLVECAVDRGVRALRPVRVWTMRANRGSVPSPGARCRVRQRLSGTACRRGELMMRISLRLILVVLLAGASPALAQDAGTLEKKPLPPLEHPDAPSTPAKELFGRETKPVP